MSRRVIRGVIVMMVDRAAMRPLTRNRAANGHDKSGNAHRKRSFWKLLYANARVTVKSGRLWSRSTDRRPEVLARWRVS